MTDSVRFKDFSPSPVAPSFRIAPDTFHCYPSIPLDSLMEIAEIAQAKETGGLERVRQLFNIFEAVIVPEDYDGFMARTKKATKEAPNPYPIGMTEIKDLLPWIMEVYGLRPTRESSESPDGSDIDDINSTEPASDEVLTS